jgi:hypothetical protein
MATLDLYATETALPVGQAADTYLRGHRNLVVIPNMGNAGDGLINFSMYALLRKRQIPFKVIEAANVDVPESDATYLVMVNGALHHDEHAMDRLIRLLTRHQCKMILHSATIQDRDQLLSELPQSTIILTREHVTSQYVRSVRPELECVLSEDATMAIADGDAELPNPGPPLRLEYRLRLFVKTLQLGFPLGFAIAPFRYGSGAKGETFSALRGDDEQIEGRPTPKTNVDLSIVCGGKQIPDHAEASAWILLKVIGSKRRIRTDRLHVAIGCALAGIECEFSANKYFKCEAIYRHSLSKRFPHIHWV